MKITKVLTVLFMLLLVVSMVIPAALAATMTVTGNWDRNGNNIGKVQTINAGLQMTISGDITYDGNTLQAQYTITQVKMVGGIEQPTTRKVIVNGRLTPLTSPTTVRKSYNYKDIIDTTGLSGTYKYTLEASGNGASSKDELFLTVTPPNRPPTFPSGSLVKQTLNENQAPAKYTIKVSDLDGDAVTVTATIPAEIQKWAKFDKATKTFTFSPGFDAVEHNAQTQANKFKEWDIDLVAEDTSNAKTPGKFTVRVNDVNQAPIINGFADSQNNIVNTPLSVKDGSTADFTVVGSDADTNEVLNYKAEYCTNMFNICFLNVNSGWGSLPSGAVIDSKSGDFIWKTSRSDIGSHKFRFTVDDGVWGGSDSEEFEIQVQDSNTPPTVDKTDSTWTFTENNLEFKQIVASDGDAGDKIVEYEVTGLRSTMAFDKKTGQVGWLPPYSFVLHPKRLESFNVVVRAKDSRNTWSSPKTVKVEVKDENQIPFFNPGPTVAPVQEGNTVTFKVSAKDEDGDALNYKMTSSPNSNAQFDVNTQTFTWNTKVGDAKQTPYTAAFEVDDGVYGGKGTHSVSFAVTAKPNNPPVIDPVATGTWTYKEGVLLTNNIVASDPEGDAIVEYQIDFQGNKDPTMIEDPKRGTLSWAAPYTYVKHPAVQKGFTVRVRAKDAKNSWSAFQTVPVVVNDNNQQPVLASIGNQQVTEEQELTFTASATDKDSEDTLRYSLSSNAPQGATIDQNTGKFSWKTKKGDAGTYSLRVTVEDYANNQKVGGADFEDIKITVSTKPNSIPVVNNPGDQSFVEGVERSFTVTGTDADADPLTFKMAALPPGATFVNGVFTWKPGFDTVKHPQTSRVIILSVTADDGRPGGVSLPVPINVDITDVNQKPKFDPVNPITKTEGDLVEFTINAKDLDTEDTLTYSSVSLPAGASFDPATKKFTWQTKKGDANSYKATFKVQDDAPLVKGEDTLSVDITISTKANSKPTVDAIPDQDFTEGVEKSFTITGKDADGDSLTFTAAALPQGATLVNGVFKWKPNFDVVKHPKTKEIITLSVTANDGKGGVSQPRQIILNVLDVNQAPVLAAIGNKATKTEQELKFTVSATDADTEDTLSYSAKNLPTGANFNAATREFSWTPTKSQLGDFKVTFEVEDNAPVKAKDSEEITISVTLSTQQNTKPVVNSLPTQKFKENQVDSFTVTATDADAGDTIQGFVVVSMPQGATFDTKTGVFTWKPNFDVVVHPKLTETGVFKVQATDGKDLSDIKTIDLEIEDTNQEPTFNPLGNMNVVENTFLTFDVSATDKDQDVIAITSNSLPNGAALGQEENLVGFAKRKFSWTPTSNQLGDHKVSFTVADKFGGSTTTTITITVTKKPNGKPTVDPIANGEWKFTEGTLGTQKVTGTDPDGDSLTFQIDFNGNTFSGAQFSQSAGVMTWNPPFSYVAHPATDKTVTVRVRAFDGKDFSDWKDVPVKVIDTNQNPVLASIGDKTGSENKLVEFTVSATDADGDSLTYNAKNLPSGATFTGQKFSWTPGFTQAGSYKVTFDVTDGFGGSDSEEITITIGNSNRAPVLAPIGNKQVNEGNSLTFKVIATDEDKEALVLSAATLPSGSAFDPKVAVGLGVSEGRFTWTPGFTQAGVYTVTFTVTDTSGLTDSETINITVGNVNRAPVIVSQPKTTISTSEKFNYQVVAVDPDNDPVTYSLVSGPSGMTMDNKGLVMWMPDGDSTVSVTVAASDGKLAATQSFRLVVNEPYKNVKFSHIHFGDEVSYPGDIVKMNVGMNNNGNEDLGDMRISAMIFDLGLRASSGEFTLESGESTSKNLQLQLPYFVEPGEYLVKFTARNDQYHETGYRVLIVE